MIRDVRPWRVGTKVGRTIYNANNELIGVMDDRDLANAVVITVNHGGGELADTNARLVAALVQIRAEIKRVPPGDPTEAMLIVGIDVIAKTALECK